MFSTSSGQSGQWRADAATHSSGFPVLRTTELPNAMEKMAGTVQDKLHKE